MGFGEIIIIMAVVLILFGPEDLPKIARVIGKLIYEIRKLTHEFTKEFENFIETPEQKKSEKSSESFSEADPSIVENPPHSGNLQQESRDSLQAENSPTQTKNPDPLAELPKDMVSYEEKGASR